MSLPTRKLGKNGPEVTALGIGLLGLSGGYGTPKPDDERYALLDHIFASGERNWDSADIYADSEDLLGRWFKRNPGKREQIFLATKFGNYQDPETGERTVRNEPEYIRAAVEKSLSRLGIKQIDLYYCHRMDSNQPIEITVMEMKKLQDQGKIKYIGLSECSAETLRRAENVVHIDAVQVEYSPFTMDIENPQIDLLRTCRELGTATVAYSPLGRGFLTGTLKSPADFGEGDLRPIFPRFSKENFHKNLELVDALQQIAKAKKATVGQLTLAWLLAQGNDIIPIPGTTRTENFNENFGALKVKISDEENETIRKEIEKADVQGNRYPEAFMKTIFADTKPLEG
ncbi:MAG: hypothetical protein Q9160_005691 [Pyrenula sp. 1 TL-2023]